MTEILYQSLKLELQGVQSEIFIKFVLCWQIISEMGSRPGLPVPYPLTFL